MWSHCPQKSPSVWFQRSRFEISDRELDKRGSIFVGFARDEVSGVRDYLADLLK